MSTAGAILSIGRPEPIAAEVRVPRRARGLIWAHRSGRTGLILCAFMLILSAAGPFVLPYEPNWPDYGRVLIAPGAEHWLGTDATGRDVLSRILDAAHRSLGAAVFVLAAIYTIGLLVGTIAGVVGGTVDAVLMRLVDVLMTLPGMILAFAVVAILGPGFHNLIIAMIIADWAYYARIARSYVLNAKRQPFVSAARLAGVPRHRILFQHIIPAAAIQLAIVASLGLGGIISSIAAFSFLGLGTQPPYAEWGSMLSESRFYFPIAPWLLIAPAAMILLAVASVNLVGMAMRDVLDPAPQK